MRPITIFYSWQSHSDRATNLNGIRDSLRVASSKLESIDEDLRIEIDEATRKLPGSPNISQAIFSKISNADIFVCDLTTINKSEIIKNRTPNPNVLIELGYAVAILGWSRIVILFNKNLGTFPDDLPFDVKGQRLGGYSIKDKSDKEGKSNLSALLKEAIELIIKEDPEKASEVGVQSLEDKKKERDVLNLRWLMSSFYLSSFDLFLDTMPNRIHIEMVYYQGLFSDKMRSSTFHLYDDKLADLLNEFNSKWDKSMSYTDHYNTDRTDTMLIFNVPNDFFPTDKARDDFHTLERLGIELAENYKELLNYIRNNYIDIDLEETSRIAFEEHKDLMKESNY